MTNWSERQFIERLKKGRIHDYSPMPFGAYKNMDETDLKALYLFFSSLEPVKNIVNSAPIAPENTIE